MSKSLFSLLIALAVALPAAVHAQGDKPGAVAAEAAEAVVVVRAVNYEMRTVTFQGPQGNLVTMDVPPEAQNLDQVHVGSKFHVRYLRSVAVYISEVGGEPAAGEASTMELAEKGATPGGTMVHVKQVQARVEKIDYDARTVVLHGPLGNDFELAVDEHVRRFNEIKPGDIVVVRYTEALAMQMIKE